MREQLLGYLLDALEPEEREQVEEKIRHDLSLQRELESLHESLEPLRAAEQHFEPPPGLAERTCQLVGARREAKQKAASPRPVPAAVGSAGWGTNPWRFADMAVAAGILLAAALLLLPALQHSRVVARRLACENNLRQLGLALTNYSAVNRNYFPNIPLRGNLSTAGVYAVRLAAGGFLEDPNALVCPSSRLAAGCQTVDIPTIDQLHAADGVRLQQLRGQMGSYGYNLGYLKDGRYRSVKNRHRPSFAIMADEPSTELAGNRSANHGGCGQNVLYEDGHVRFLPECLAKGCRDHIFLNDDGLMAAGNHENDAVVGHASSSPLLHLVSDDD